MNAKNVRKKQELLKESMNLGLFIGNVNDENNNKFINRKNLSLSIQKSSFGGLITGDTVIYKTSEETMKKIMKLLQDDLNKMNDELGLS